MLDIKFIKDNVDVVKNAVRNKCLNTDIDKLLELHETIRQATSTIV